AQSEPAPFPTRRASDLDKSGAPYETIPFQGELGYVQACIKQAELLARAWHTCSDMFPGVWCYEVAEPFGLIFGRHLLAGGGPERDRKSTRLNCSHVKSA